MIDPHLLIPLAEQVPDPDDYFVGVRDTSWPLPGNVLQFLRRTQPDAEVSFHYRYVLIVALQESGGVILDGEVYRIAPGEGLLIFPFQSHHFTPFRNPQQVRWLFTTFEHEAAECLEPLRNTPFRLEAADADALRDLTAAFVAWRRGGRDSRPLVPWKLGQFLYGWVERSRRRPRRSAGRRLGVESPPGFVGRVARHVFVNMNRPVRVEELARVAGLSSSRLRARFRESVGVSLGTFVRRTRVHRACGLLQGTGKRVTEIAEACGFESLYSFSRTFKQVTGQSPREYRSFRQRPRCPPRERP